jgi:hypothetical protein
MKEDCETEKGNKELYMSHTAPDFHTTLGFTKHAHGSLCYILWVDAYMCTIFKHVLACFFWCFRMLCFFWCFRMLCEDQLTRKVQHVKHGVSLSVSPSLPKDERP